MKLLSCACALAIGVVVASCRTPHEAGDEPASAPVALGLVRGHIRLTGPAPENEILRMGADPMCKQANGGRQVRDEAVVVAPDGALANVFVEVVGDFPATSVPAEPVTIDQRGCVYRPRVVGLRVGQSLRVGNSDNGLHNVHGASTDRDSFNVSQPVSGMSNTFHPHDPGILKLKCDVHTWMVAFVGVVNHPYFAVTGADGAFVLRDVPEGTYEVRAWHETFGNVSSQVRVDSAREATLDLTYSGTAAATP